MDAGSSKPIEFSHNIRVTASIIRNPLVVSICNMTLLSAFHHGRAEH